MFRLTTVLIMERFGPTANIIADKPSATDWPKITLVTPVLNAARYIEEAIRSVVYQGYPNLEYIIVDGGSTDGTVEIVRKYEQYLAWWVSEPDQGLYPALNKGFARSSGEIMGWINGTDMLHVGSLFVIGSVFRTFPQVEWITGTATFFNEQGMPTVVRPLQRWSRMRFLANGNRYIQQESTFWRRSLWEKAGSYVDASLKLFSDCELWARFFRYARLYTVGTLIGGYRCHQDSLGSQNVDKMQRIENEIIEAELKLVWWGVFLKLFRRINAAIQLVPKVRGVWNLSLKRVPALNLSPVIMWDEKKQKWIMKRWIMV